MYSVACRCSVVTVDRKYLEPERAAAASFARVR
jgi:hypothetical protein